jgi:hypothetical protein
MKPFKTVSAIFMLLVFAACAQTTATKTTRPQKEETRQTSQTGSKTSSGTAESEQQETQTKSKSGQATATEEAESQKMEPRSPTEAESEPQKFEPESSTGQVAAKDSADAKLAKARENLRISQKTEKRIAAELEQLKQSGSASDETIRDYETYLKSVQAMTAENRKIVAQMEAAYAKQASVQSGSDAPSYSNRDKPADPGFPQEESMDEVAALDRQLNASLAKFDGMLLKELEEIRAGSSEKLQDLAEEAAEAARRLREKGLDVDTSGSNSSEESQEGREGKPQTDRETGSAEGRSGSETASGDRSRQGGEGQSNKNQRRENYEDDDIVARQLREAAENETDPELKEKLWKEYEEYKKSK